MYSVDGTPEFEIGTTAMHMCDAGFALVGVANRTCVDDNQEDIVGVWSEIAPTCDGKSLYSDPCLFCYIIKPFF